MHSLLAKLLERRGIKDLSELKEDKDLRSHGIPDEKSQFDQWNRILSEGDITVEKIANFCKNQITQIEAIWRNKEKSKEQKADLIAYHTCYSLILEAIHAPKVEKEQLEAYLNQLLAE